MGAAAVRCKTSCELFTNVLAGLCSRNIRTTIKLIADENNQKHSINTQPSVLVNFCIIAFLSQKLQKNKEKRYKKWLTICRRKNQVPNDLCKNANYLWSQVYQSNPFILSFQRCRQLAFAVMGQQKVIKEEEVKNILSLTFFPVKLQQLALRNCYLLQFTSHRIVLISLFFKKNAQLLLQILLMNEYFGWAVRFLTTSVLLCMKIQTFFACTHSVKCCF